MKLTQSQIRQIIKEETGKVLKEMDIHQMRHKVRSLHFAILENIKNNGGDVSAIDENILDSLIEKIFKMVQWNGSVGSEENMMNENEQEESDLFSAMEYIFINAMDGMPVAVSNVEDLSQVPSNWYMIKDNRLYPTETGVAYLKAKGVPVHLY